MATCHVCGAEVDHKVARFCHACGAPLRLAAASVVSREERRLVTILFCDLVDSTSRFDLADPEDVKATLASYLGRVQREIERFDGTVEKFIGDAVMAVYGAPTAHEDDAQRAVFSALRILPVIEEMNEDHPQLPLAVRIGVETGEAIVDLGAEPSRQGIVFGDVVNTASRLQTAAPTGRILVGEGTYRLTHTVFDYKAIEPVTVKGKAKPLRVWVATATKSRLGAEHPRSSTTPWVDRDEELELVKRAFERAALEPTAQLVTLIGEPGVGKSRLVREFFGYIDDLRQTLFWREGRCLPYGEGVTFWALAEVVKAQAGILASDGAVEAGTKLASATSALIEDPAEREWIRARLAPLIGLAEGLMEGTDRVETFSAWRRFLEAMAAIRPMILVLEDMHWADVAMLAFVEHVMEWSGGLPILILCTARPDLFDKDPGWGRGKRNWSTVTLTPLADEDAGTLVSALLPPGSPTPLQRLVVERSGGNPLFAEEFAQMLREQLTPDPGGASPSHRLLAPNDTPASLHALIAARLDTLTLSLKSLLLDASVIGRTFWAGALTSMSGLDRDVVHAQLRELARKELIRPSRASSVREEAEYAFWHTLIRDVAYGQIPRVRRAPKHIAVAEWIERMAGERVSDRAELLAHHYGQALDLIRATGAPDEIATLEAITRRYWKLAGERAMGLDVARAAECFEQALELFPSTDPGRADVVARLAAAAFDSGRIRDAQAAYEQAIDLFDENDDRLARGRSLDRLATVLWEQGDTAGSRIRLAQAVELLEAEPHGPELADCYTSLASDRMVSGRFDEALAWAERSISLSSELGAEHLRPRALGFRGVAKCYGGDLAGLDDLHAAIAIAERLGLARDQANVLVILAEVLWATDGPSAALEAVERASALATRRGLEDVVVACRTQSLGPLFDLGRWDEVLTIADDVIRWSVATGGGYDEITSQLWQGQVLIWREQRSPETSIADLMIPAREIADPQVLVPAVVVSGLIAVEENRPDEVQRLIKELERATDVGLGWYREQFLLDLVRLCVFAGDLASASRFVDRADAFTTRHRLALLGARAVVDEARGALPDAAAIYREVELGWASYGHLVEEGRAALGVGRCLARSGEEGARPELLRAREIFEQLGAPRLLDEADTHLAESDLR